MAERIQSAHPIQGTGEAIPQAQLIRDAQRILDVVASGGVAVIPLDVAYAIVGGSEGAIRRIFTAKNRSYEKPSGLFSSPLFSDEIHDLTPEKRAMIHEIIREENLPLSVVAPFNPQHRFFGGVDPFVLAHSSKQGTIDMLLNAGSLHNELVKLSWDAGIPVFGSSANTSLMGSKYRADDIESAVLDAADLVIDYGLSKYHNPHGRSSTIIDFSDFSVIRVGVCFDQLKEALHTRFGVRLQVKQ
ncbi:MAG: L-threonylcarbamoyladenylate synthase [Burkholderiaceae bacterium]